MKSSDSTRNGEEQYHYRITVTTTDATPSHQQLFSGSDKDPKSRDNYLTTLPFLPSNAPFFENAYRSSRPSNPWEQFRFPSLTHQNVLELPMSFGPTPTYHRRMASMAAQMHAASTSNTRTAKTALKKNHPWAAASTRPRSEGQNVFAKLPAVISVPMGQIEALGPPHLQIFKVSLPFHAANTFQRVIDACEDHAWHRLDQWETNLYSLTKQDIAVADVPGGLELVKDIQDYVVSSIRCLYHQPIVHMDRNQPHVLKYDGGTNHRSVPLHHDQCHGTSFDASGPHASF